MRVRMSTALIIAALLLTIASTVAGFIVSPGGYLAPLCTGYPTTAPAPSYYNQIELVITHSSSSDLPLTVPVNWVLVGGCVVKGTFAIGLNPGIYSVTITSCYGIRAAVYLPYSPLCSGLPKTVIVQSGTWTRVDISITTGIY